ncbi:MAG TPA: segregation/condensation protein A [Candidatus Acidoferrales bacterium]|nr:segregation/condensation protein A [Candidatus Acidoferrales bacterium]
MNAQAQERGDRTFQVSLDVFAGPLDLLLNLVREQQLDIATVPLASVAQQYLQYIKLMEELDVEVAAEYLVIAATLIFLKSKSLLPPVPSEFLPEGEESAEEVEDRLRRRLITYSKYRGAADELRARLDASSAYYYRDAGDPGTEVVQRYRIPVGKLAAALLSALRSAKPEGRTITRQRVSLVAQMDFVLRHLRERGMLEFSELCRDLDRSAVIVTFLAVLELIRQSRITYQQESPHDALRLLPYQPVEIYVN